MSKEYNTKGVMREVKTKGVMKDTKTKGVENFTIKEVKPKI